MNFGVPPPSSANIPILGQLVTILGGIIIAHVRCNCEAQTPLLVQGGSQPVQCPGCQRAYVLEAKVELQVKTATPPPAL